MYSEYLIGLFGKEGKLLLRSTTCKDFLQDSVLENFKEMSFNETRLLLSGTFNKNHPEIILDFMHQIESRLHLKRSVIENFTNESLTLVGSGKWLIAAPMINLYGLMARTAPYHVIGQSYIETTQKIANRDHKHWILALKGLERIEKEGWSKIFGEEPTINNYCPPRAEKTYYDYHDFCSHTNGIVSFSQKVYEKHFPQWYKGEDE